MKKETICIKKTIKKSLSIFLILSLCLSLFGTLPVSAETSYETSYNEYEYEHYTYTIAEGNIVTITAVDSSISGSITIPDTFPNSYGYDCPVVAIERGAFDRCDYLTDVTIPDSVTFIDSSAFFDCNSLTAINVSGGNSVYSTRDGVLFDKSGTTLIKYPDAKMDHLIFSEYTVPDGVTVIGAEAFQWCSFISITIPDSVKSIEDLAFNSCYQLEEVIIGSGVTEINPSAFFGCRGLYNISVSNQNEAYSSEDGVLYNKDKTTLIKYPSGSPAQSYTLPESVAVIGYSAFSDVWGLMIYYSGTKAEFDAITIEDGNDDFLSANIVFTGYYTYTITNNQATIIAVDSSISEDITIPDTLGGCPVTEIGEFAFNYCTDLTGVTIPDGVTSIGPGAFLWCVNLKSVAIPASVIFISGDVFDGCVSLTYISVSDENEYFSSFDGILFDKDKNKLIRYPIGKDSLSYTIPASVSSVGDYAFSECTSLTNITFHNSVSFIGRYAFNNCSALLSIAIPSDVSIICSGAFSGCTSITRLTIPYGVICIEEYAFSACTSLENVTIPDSVQTIMSGAFANCSSLTDVTLSENIDYISDHTFAGCSNLTSITIPDNVEGISFSAFYDCSSLTEITIPASVSYIGREAFYNCTSLESISFPNKCTASDGYIERDAFNFCTALTNITIPDGITQIGDNAFANCSSLTEITIPKSVAYIGTLAFDSAALDTIYYNGTKDEFMNISASMAGDPFTGENAKKIFFHYVDFDGYSTKVSDIENGNKVILALYKSKQLTDMQPIDFNSENIEFTSDKPYDTAKILVWKDFKSCRPIIAGLTLVE